MFSGLDYCYISEYLYGNSIPGTYLSKILTVLLLLLLSLLLLLLIAIINVNSAKITKAIIINITAGTIIY